MFRNQYDQDCVTWSPQGRIHQIEFATEAVKQGSAAVGLCSSSHVVLATIKRSVSDLSSYQQKIFRLDDHMGVAVAGLTADGRVLSRYMRDQCTTHHFVYETRLSTTRLVRDVADKSQMCTQRSWARPYGVGMLIAGVDQSGPKLFHTCPSGNFTSCSAFAIGSRAQASKTYLERHYVDFKDSTLDQVGRTVMDVFNKR
mmetsp:Transcript_11363/g.39516  ORF Transcript_11363/g.39516 Transcript_11363/m.39516 type:complete len:199 (-) Transcript_11363:1311-1907(-)